MQVTYKNESLPDGYEVSLTGLPVLLLNNQSVEVSDEAVAQYEATTGKSFDDLMKGTEFGGKGRTEQDLEAMQPEELDYIPGTTVVEHDEEDAQDTSSHDGVED